MKRVIPILFLVILVALGVAGYRVYEAYKLVFPALPSGVYGGVLHIDGGLSRSLFVDSSRAPRDLVVALEDEAMPAQRATTVDASGATGLPLIITGSGTRLRLVGSEKRPGRYEGSFIDPIRNEKGRWVLQRFDVPPLSQAEQESLAAWGAAFLELRAVEHELFDVMGASDPIFGRRATEAVGTGDDISSLTGDLDTAVRTMESAAKVSPQGVLVSLSRESIARDARWIEQVLEAGLPDTKPSFGQEVERAYRVKDLLDQISEERRKLDALEGADREREEVAGEEEFHGDL